MSDFDHGLDLSHLTVWPPQPTTLAGIGLIARAIFQPELAIPALITGLIAIIGDDKKNTTSRSPLGRASSPRFDWGSANVRSRLSTAGGSRRALWVNMPPFGHWCSGGRYRA